MIPVDRGLSRVDFGADSVQRRIDAVIDALERRHGTAREIIRHRSGYQQLHYGELARIDASDGTVYVGLPDVRPSDVGLSITVVGVSQAGSGAVVLRAAPGNSINGESSVSLPSGYGVRMLLAVDRSTWALLSIQDGATQQQGRPWQHFAWAGGRAAPSAEWSFDWSASQLVDHVSGATLVESYAPAILGGNVSRGIGDDGHRGVYFSTSRLGAYYLKGDTSATWDVVRTAGSVTIELVYTHFALATTPVIGCGNGLTANQHEQYGVAVVYPQLVNARRADISFGASRTYTISQALYGIMYGSTHYLAVVYDTSSGKVYHHIDGRAEPVKTTLLGNPNSGQISQSIFTIGAYAQGANVANDIVVHGVRITKAALSDSDVLQAWEEVRPK